MAMKPRTTDFSALSKINFEFEPVGVKFEYFKPEGIEPLETPMAMCEMPREAQKRDTAFYMDRSNENCMGKGAMGMMSEDPSWAAAGLIGERMDIFRDATGEMFESKATPVFQCSWLFSYPVTTNKVNYIPMGMGHGTTARRCYRKGELLCSVPRPWFGTILESLNEMPLVPEAWEMTREEWLEVEEGIYGKIISDAQKAGWA